MATNTSKEKHYLQRIAAMEGLEIAVSNVDSDGLLRISVYADGGFLEDLNFSGTSDLLFNGTKRLQDWMIEKGYLLKLHNRITNTWYVCSRTEVGKFPKI